MNTNEIYQKHYVAVIGGSIAGSETASILAQNGFRVVVFDMNALPYGKIEDGLPNWHITFRERQIPAIDKKLDHPNIRLVGNTEIGSEACYKEWWAKNIVDFEITDTTTVFKTDCYLFSHCYTNNPCDTYTGPIRP